MLTLHIGGTSVKDVWCNKSSNGTLTRRATADQTSRDRARKTAGEQSPLQAHRRQQKAVAKSSAITDADLSATASQKSQVC